MSMLYEKPYKMAPRRIKGKMISWAKALLPQRFPLWNLETLEKVTFSVPKIPCHVVEKCGKLLPSFALGALATQFGPVWASSWEIRGSHKMTFAQHLCLELANSAVDKRPAGSVLSLRSSLPVAELLFNFPRNQLQPGWPGALGIGPEFLSRIWPFIFPWSGPPILIWQFRRCWGNQLLGSFCFSNLSFLRDLSLPASLTAEMGKKWASLLPMLVLGDDPALNEGLGFKS